MPLLIDIRKLTVINQLIEDGAENVVASLESLAGVEAHVEIKSISFVEPTDIAAEMGQGKRYSTHVQLTEPPYGVFLLTFSEESAAEVAGLMTAQPVDDDLNQLHRSALGEMCNILTSGFIDGIANTLETTIDFDTPELAFEDAGTIADDALSHVRRDSMSIVLDSLVDIEESDAAFTIRIFLIPDPGSFVHTVDGLELDATTHEPVAADTTEVEEMDMSADIDDLDIVTDEDG
ncbi:MAG: chemotaxis protein CheC [Haloarculaceae archaeon]